MRVRKVDRMPGTRLCAKEKFPLFPSGQLRILTQNFSDQGEIVNLGTKQKVQQIYGKAHAVKIK